MLQYGPSLGFQPLREWLAEWQGVAVDRVLTSNGSLQLIEFLCLRVLRPGDVVFTESPTYDRTLTLLRRHGAKVVGIPLEADGPDIDGARSGARKSTCRSSSTSSRTSRIRRARPARARSGGRSWSSPSDHGFLIVEDAPYRLLRYRGHEEPTLYELAPERTLHMSSFTKLIAPGVRTGFMIGEPKLIATLAKAAEDTYISPGYVAQGITYEWCRRGLLPPADRAPETALRAAPRRVPRGARHVHAGCRGDAARWRVLRLADAAARACSTSAVRTEAATRGLNLADGLAFFPDGGGERFLRLPFCALSPAEIDDGVRRLAESVQAVS